MTRALTTAPLTSFAFAAALSLTAAAASLGLMPDNAVALWAAAAMGADGQLSFGSLVTHYPNIPLVAAAALQFLLPSGAPAPALIAAGLLGALAGLWFRAARATGFSAPFAAAATLLVAFHPMLLGAVLAGPADMFLAVFLYLFGTALYDLRARTRAPEVMMAGLSLLGVVFSHPMGAAIAVAAVPFLGFAVRPIFAARSAPNMVLTLIFPALFGAAAFAYLAWIFGTDGLPFAAADGAVQWLAGVETLLPDAMTGMPALIAGLLVAAAFLVAAPAAVIAVAWIFRRRPLAVPAAIFAATTIAAAALAAATGLFGSPAAAIIAAPVMAAIVLARVPIERRRRPMILLLLIAGFCGGGFMLVWTGLRSSAALVAVLPGHSGNQQTVDTLALGSASKDRNGILIDAFNAPAVVLGRGGSAGLLLPSSDAFVLTMLFARIDAPYVAVPDPHSNVGAVDHLNKSFPTLYETGLPAYRLIYQNQTWRLFERER